MCRRNGYLIVKEGSPVLLEFELR